MNRYRCSQIWDNGKQCRNMYRSRVEHDRCRKCHVEITGVSREITSRDKSENKYRRTKSRRKNVVVKKVSVSTARKGKKNGNSQSIEV